MRNVNSTLGVNYLEDSESLDVEPPRRPIRNVSDTGSLEVGKKISPVKKRGGTFTQIRAGASNNTKQQTKHSPAKRIRSRRLVCDIDEEDKGKLESNIDQEGKMKLGIDIDQDDDCLSINSDAGSDVLLDVMLHDNDSDSSKNVNRNIESESRPSRDRKTENDKSESKFDISFLDDIFLDSKNGAKSPRKPAPGRRKKQNKTNVNNDIIDVDNHNVTMTTEECPHQQSLLHESTLKDESLDCFSDPLKWKKRKRKVNVPSFHVDSDDAYNELFTSGLMKKKSKPACPVRINSNESPVKSYDRTPSLF